jgi:hypothetical protein
VCAAAAVFLTFPGVERRRGVHEAESMWTAWRVNHCGPACQFTSSKLDGCHGDTWLKNEET